MDDNGRRSPLAIAGVLLVTVVLFVLAVLTLRRGGPVWLILLAIVASFAVPVAGMAWVVKARTGFLLGPLFAAPSDVRKRVIQAMHGVQQPLADEAEQRLALVEARRIRLLTPVFVPLMALLFLLLAWSTRLRLTDDDRSLAAVGWNAVCAAFFAFQAVRHVFSHRRCGAYLDRFDAPRQQT